MAVFKVHLNKDYTVMSNHHLRNKELSLKAKGLLSVMLGLPDDWDYSVNGLAAISKEGRRAVDNALKELKENGYVVVKKLYPNQTDSGLIEYEYNIFEFPQHQDTHNQDVQNQDIHFEGVENSQQLNTNKSITKELNTYDIKENKQRKDESEIMALFESFWKVYPKKVAKKKAKQSWKSVCKNKETYNAIMKALTTQIVIHKWDKNNRYCPHPATWLNQERWNDDVEVTHGTTKKSSAEYGISVL